MSDDTEQAWRRTSLLLDKETTQDLEFLMRYYRHSSASALMRQIIADAAKRARQEEAVLSRKA